MKQLFPFCVLLLLCSFTSVAANKKYDAFQVKVSGKGQPVLLIPGATCSGDEWKETVAHLSGSHECHVFTLAGYAGAPPLSKGPYLETIKNQIEQYMEDKKLNNVILIGHSIGGVLSLWIASDRNVHLQKVVIVDAMPFFAAAQSPNTVDTFDESKAIAMLDNLNKMNENQMKFNQMMTARYMCNDSTKWNAITSWGLQSDKKTMAYTMAEMNSKDLRQTISKVNIPVLVLAAYGKIPQYPQFTRESVIETFADQYKACGKCTVHVAADKTKHFVMYDAPEWYYKEMDDFINP
ncbi:MAG: alpha/beta fold hydrolase [Chitinophagales bacterium]